MKTFLLVFIAVMLVGIAEILIEINTNLELLVQHSVETQQEVEEQKDTEDE